MWLWSNAAQEAAPPSLQIAALEFSRGEYGAALDAARQAPPSVDRLLAEVKILHRMRRPEEVLDTLLRLRTLPFAHPSALNLAAAYEAVSLAALTNLDAARRVLANVTVPAQITDPLDDESAYLAASCAWMLGEFDRTLAMLDGIGAGSTPISQARAEVVRGWAHAARSEHDTQFECAARALAVLKEHPAGDVGLVANVLRLCAALSRDRAETLLIDDIESLERTLPWTRWMMLERFQVVRTIAWAYAMRGEYIRAIRALARAKTLAPNAQSKMLSHLDHAWIASISDEPLHMQAELLEADACAENVDWNAAADEEAGALLLAAELYAAIDGAQAQSYLERARALRERIAPWMGFAHDRRFDGFFLIAEATVQFARGDRAGAARHAHQAYEIFAGVGYAWRAATAALLAFRSTGGNECLKPVAAVAERYPRSFIARAFERLRATGASPVDRLTRRQRQITDAIRRGLRTDAIARELNMAPNTVRVHKNKIFKAFGVSSEFELLGRLQEEVA